MGRRSANAERPVRRVGAAGRLRRSPWSTRSPALTLSVVPELDGNGALVSQFVYGAQGHVPDFMFRAGKTYRIVSDERGSVLLVVDTTTGAVAQRMDYDAWTVHSPGPYCKT